MPLSEDQRKHLERRLHEERERAMRVIRREQRRIGVSEPEASGDISNYPFHLADIGSESFDRELDAQLASRASAELAAIDAALSKLYREPERYGICEDTGEEIPFERLDLVPWARTCR